MKKQLALILFLVTGCMQPESGDPSREGAPAGVEDPDLLAGASSSTNWPSEDAGDSSHLLVSGHADSLLVLHFGTTSARKRISGQVSVFHAGIIPALDSIPLTVFPFQDADSILIRPEQLSIASTGGKDTLSFSVRVEIDTAQCLLIGFAFSRSGKTFLTSPYSRDPERTFPFSRPRYSFKVTVDSALIRFGGYSEGKSEWCFYIPGSPYFWKVGFDSLVEIGPVPNGIFPLRLLRISHPDGASNQNRLEVYEVLIKKVEPTVTQHSSFPVIRLGEKLLTASGMTSYSIRPGNL